MRRTRLFVDQVLRANTELEIEGDRARYAGRVLRLRPDDELTLFNGRGGEYQACIQSFTRKGVQVSVGTHINRDVTSTLSIHLLQSISRGDRMDIVMQKATELGVARITPLITAHSVVKLPKDRAQSRLLRWRGITTNACEQCGRNTLPIVDEPVGIVDWLAANAKIDGAKLMLNPGASGSISSIKDANRFVTVLIGPEGGFSDDEADLAVAHEFDGINFGPRLLRTETAALAVLASLQTLFGDLAGEEIGT